MEVKIKKLKKEARIDKPAHKGDAGFDVYYPGPAVDVHQLGRVALPLGISLEIPEGYYARVEDKSGIFKNEGLVNAGKIIDSNYRGEIHAQIFNSSKRALRIESGRKVAQIIFQKHETPTLKEVDTLGETSRGEGKFGSTGIKEKKMDKMDDYDKKGSDDKDAENLKNVEKNNPENNLDETKKDL